MSDLGTLGERSGRALRLPAACGGLDQLRQEQDWRPQPAPRIGGPLSGGQGVLVAAEPVVADCAAPVGGGEPEPLASSQHVLPARVAECHRLGVLAPPVRQHDRGAQRQMTPGGLDDRV
jgi:hypothetical protein